MNIFSKLAPATLLVLPLACGGDPEGSDGNSMLPSGTGGDLATGSGGAGSDGVEAGSGGANLSTGTGGTGSGGIDGTGATTGGEMAVPSPGCSKATARPADGVVYKAGESWLVFPEKYNGQTPLPVVVGFHGCGSGNKGTATGTEFKGHFDGTDIGNNYVRALPLSIDDGGCYSNAGDMARAKALFTNLVENYCVDLSRVFGVGHSYGAGFLMGMTGNKGDFDHFGFRGIAPVAGWEIASANVQVPTMYVQAYKDTQRDNSDGANVAARVGKVNGCGTDTTPFPTIACNSSSGGAPVDSGCKLYSACDETTIWCRHNDQAYGTSFHGIPCFYNETVYDFFESL